MTAGIDLMGATKGAFLGGLGAGVLCIGIYFAASASGADFRPANPELMMGMQVLPPFQPMVNCLLAAAISAGLLALLVKLTRERAWSIYLGIAALVFLAEAFAPFWAFNDLKTILALELMHVPAALGVVGGIHRFGRRPVAAT